MYDRSACTVTTSAPGSNAIYPLGNIGPVTAVGYADTMPGGPDSFQCTLQTSPGLVQPQPIAPGRTLQVWVGGTVQWEGVLDRPTPGTDGTWQITAKGAGTYGDRYIDIYSTWTDVNDHIDQAIARGLDWHKGTLSNTNLYFVDQQASGSQSITSLLNLLTKPGYYTWHIGRRNALTIFPVPTVPTRVLFSSSPQARALAAFVNALYVLYQSSADNADTGAAAVNSLTVATNAASIARHGRTEQVWDITGAGTLTGSAALAWASAAITRYNALSWAGPIPVQPGAYTTTTGVPVALQTEHAGEVVKLVLGDGPYDAEVAAFPPVTFPVGRFEYDDDSGAAGVSPFNVIQTDLGSLLDSMAIWLPRPPVTG